MNFRNLSLIPKTLFICVLSMPLIAMADGSVGGGGGGGPEADFKNALVNLGSGTENIIFSTRN